jgi:hypothetical protein
MSERSIKKVGLQEYVAIDFYDKEPELVRAMLIKELSFRAEKEGYELYSDPLGMILGYIKLDGRGFTPVEKENANMVEIYFSAKAIEKELK